MPTRKTFFWIAAALVLYLIAWNIGSGWLYIITALLVSYPLASIVICRLNIRNLEVEQAGAGTSVDGGTANSTLSIINRSLLPHFFLTADCRYGGSQQNLFLSSARGSQKIDRSLEFSALERGIYPGAEIVVTSSAPMGLARCRRKRKTSCPLTVFPAWHRLGSDWDTGHLPTGAMRSSSLPTRSASSDYLGVRDYRSEDSPRSIHWRTSARANNLAVIEYARQAAMAPVFILDTWIGFLENKAAFESAISATASLVMRETSNRRRFGLGSSAADAAARGLGYDGDAAMHWLAGLNSEAPGPINLDIDLPWPDVTAVLLLSSHIIYRQSHRSLLLASHPHTIVIAFDIRGFEGPGIDSPDLMDDRMLAELADDLDQIGCRMLVIDQSNSLAPCLHRL